MPDPTPFDWSTTIDLVLKLSTLLAIIIAAVGLFQSAWAHGRQMNADIFLTYTKRFEEVMSTFPQTAWQARLDLADCLPEASPELTLAVLKYLNLCAEEYYLWRHGYLKTEVWNIWSGEMVRTLRTPLFRREWKTLACEFGCYGDFRAFVDKAQAAPVA